MSKTGQVVNDIHQASQFWLEQSQQIKWYTPPTIGLQENSDSSYSWFDDGSLNTCYLSLDCHVECGRGDHVAFYYDSPVTKTKQQITYSQLLHKVEHFAGAMKNMGIVKGDRVIIYMPMIIEAAIAMLACARIGAIHSVVFGGFAASELAVRIDDVEAKLLITASCGIEFEKVIAYKPLVDEAIEKAQHKPQKCVVFQRETLTADLSNAFDIDWIDFIQDAQSTECVSMRASDPLYILYTSGTTGRPKGIVRDNGGHAVAMKFAFSQIYGMTANDVWWAASDIGWVVGHSFIVYAPLMCGASSVFYEGKPINTPDAGAFGRVIEEYKVNSMICAPTAFRAIRALDPTASLLSNYSTKSLRWVFVAGERLDSSTYHWLEDTLKVPILDHWWQTETGWPITAPLMGSGEPKPTRVGSTNSCTPGFDLRILNDQHEEVASSDTGNICLKLPLPPGVSNHIWNQPERFKNAYLKQFPGYYQTGDGGYKDADDYVYITGRTDDVINVSGHRLSTAEMEEVVANHRAIVECAVVGAPDPLKGQVPLAMIVLKSGSNIEESQLQDELINAMRKSIGPLACFKQIIVVQRLPKTRSGKILRAILRKIVANEHFEMPATIDDPQVLDHIEQCLAQRV